MGLVCLSRGQKQINPTVQSIVLPPKQSNKGVMLGFSEQSVKIGCESRKGTNQRAGGRMTALSEGRRSTQSTGPAEEKPPGLCMKSLLG